MFPTKSGKVCDQVCHEHRVKDLSVPHPFHPKYVLTGRIKGVKANRQKVKTQGEHALCCQEFSRWGKRWKHLHVLHHTIQEKRSSQSSQVTWTLCKIAGQQPRDPGWMTEQGVAPTSNGWAGSTDRAWARGRAPPLLFRSSTPHARHSPEQGTRPSTLLSRAEQTPVLREVVWKGEQTECNAKRRVCSNF